MKHALFAFAVASLAAGCTTATKLSGPSGEPLVSVTCDGFAQSAVDCLRRVSEECPNGYQIVGATSSSTPIATGGNSYGWGGGSGGGGGSFAAGSMIQRNVIAMCK